MVVPRKERHPNSLERISNCGSPRDLTLLVCPILSKAYFQDLVNYLGLDTKVAVEPINSNKSFELQVEEAVEISLNAKPHHRLFAILDFVPSVSDEKDQTKQILQAHKLVLKQDLPNNRIFRLLITTPGFPLWLLLHFKLVDFSAYPDVEWSELVAKELGPFSKDFLSKESHKDYFNLCYPYLETAIKNSQKLQLLRTIKPGPSSEIHELMAYLLKLQRRYVL
ncbi:MAG: RloB domain-containing protein [Magnetococcales bacterium]|nr:RloB domain-containing protein [Magnetococcales bacterium]